MIGRLDDEQIEEILHSNNMGRIGCRDNDLIYVVPINYIYDGNSIIAHSVAGMKIEMMRKYPDVCFQVDQIKEYNNWKSVVAWGQYQELTGERERYDAMKLFVERTLKLKISETAIAPAKMKMSAFKIISVTKKSDISSFSSFSAPSNGIFR